MQARAIDVKVVANERKNEFGISRISRFRYRTRYFTDSGINGSKEFVFSNYQRFNHLSFVSFGLLWQPVCFYFSSQRKNDFIFT